MLLTRRTPEEYQGQRKRGPTCHGIRNRNEWSRSLRVTARHLRSKNGGGYYLLDSSGKFSTADEFTFVQTMVTRMCRQSLNRPATGSRVHNALVVAHEYAQTEQWERFVAFRDLNDAT